MLGSDDIQRVTPRLKLGQVLLSKVVGEELASVRLG